MQMIFDPQRHLDYRQFADTGSANRWIHFGSLHLAGADLPYEVVQQQK
jgi:hypothetical protein